MKLYTNSQTAEMLGISLRTLDARRKSGMIAYSQPVPGGKIMFSEDAITQYLARINHRAAPEKKDPIRRLRRA